MLKRIMLLVMLGSVALGSFGCVAQSEVDRYKTLHKSDQEQIAELQARLAAKDQQIDMLQKAQSNDQATLDELSQLKAQRDQLAKALDDAKAKLLAASRMGVGPLPPELNDALVKLAASNPSLMTYDPKLGMVKFHSDLTFDLGSTRVKPAAVTGLDKLASVINSPLAADYEVRIVGYTDNVPVTNPVNKRKYGDNWGLSAFRAIAVKDVLQSAGVAPQRMSVTGYGQYHPVVPNGPHGAEANRRVEIYLVPQTTSPGAAETQPAPPAANATAPAAKSAPATKQTPEMFK